MAAKAAHPASHALEKPMHRLLLICSALFLLASTTAHAGPGVNLRWTDCFGDGGLLNRNFACDTNSGNHFLIASFELGQPILQALEQEMVLDLAAADASLPSWWAFRNVATCRQQSLFLTFNVPLTSVACQDWGRGKTGGGIGYYRIGHLGPNTARLALASAVPNSDPPNLVAGQEYYSFSVVINSARTVGTDSCNGCTVPVCLVFSSLKVKTPIAANDRTLTGATNGTDSFYATWQGGGVPMTPRGTGCPAATPTRKETWSGVKSLYR